MEFAVSNTSPRSLERAIRALRKLADDIENGSIEYQSGAIVIGKDDAGVYVSSDLRMVMSEHRRDKV